MSSLKGNAKFDSVFSSNDYQVQDGPFKILLKKNITNELSLGLIIPKKKVALASNRNFVKRRAREIIKNKKLLGHDIIFLVRQKIKDFDKAKIKNHINNLKRKLESISNATQSNQ